MHQPWVTSFRPFRLLAGNGWVSHHKVLLPLLYLIGKLNPNFMLSFCGVLLLHPWLRMVVWSHLCTFTCLANTLIAKLLAAFLKPTSGIFQPYSPSCIVFHMPLFGFFTPWVVCINHCLVHTWGKKTHDNVGQAKEQISHHYHVELIDIVPGLMPRQHGANRGRAVAAYRDNPVGDPFNAQSADLHCVWMS